MLAQEMQFTLSMRVDVKAHDVSRSTGYNQSRTCSEKLDGTGTAPAPRSVLTLLPTAQEPASNRSNVPFQNK